MALATLLFAAIVVAPGPRLAAAQSADEADEPADEIPEPPLLGAVVLRDALRDGTVIPTGVCPTGRAVGENVGDGLRLKVQGRCRSDDSDAIVQVLVRGLGTQDGEIAIDFKPVAGAQHSSVRLFTRVVGRSWLAAYVNPGDGTVTLMRSSDGAVSELASRSDLAEQIHASDWNRLALRTDGDQAWLLLNAEPVLYAQDAGEEAGRAGVGLARLGSPDSSDEATVLLRDLTVAALAEGDAERAPVYQRP